VHGALHTRQWLRKPDRLALVDFDRCAMGDAELDIATFLAEWDYESVPIGERVKSAFMAHINGKNVARIAFYRAHKHLSKAFKASRALKTGAQAKVQRNLQRLRWVLAQAPELGR
jgi:thiamine kinase-like enzyme